jgi:catechol 2,3-dioxygenase-like lactoylglutathione lyase family enzyme
MAVLALDHVQLAMPPGGEDEARGFYVGLLGFVEAAKPPQLAVRGGCWFEAGSAQLHLGVEADFRPARKAHPALIVDDLAELRARLEGAAIRVEDGEPLDGILRVHVDDPFGNRVELMQRI